MKPDELDLVFAALANETRRRILDIVKSRSGCSVQYVTDHFTLSRIAVLKHVRLLEQAGLLISDKVGRQRRLYFNCVPIQIIHDRWTTEYSALWASKLAELKYRIENQGKDDG